MSWVIDAAEWNALMRELMRKLNVQVSEIDGGEWQHPWHTRASWSPDKEQWQATVRPGFVNGLDVTSLVEASEVPLTDTPAIPLTSWRIIGDSADPVSITASETDDRPQISYEPVPDFFVSRGVRSSGEIRTDLDSEVPQRRLRACDIVLHHDRPGLATVPVGNDISVGIRTSSSARDHGYLSITRLHQTEATPDPLQQLKGDWSDSTSDSIQVCTVYLLSPTDTAADEAPDEKWQPFVKHELFWNLLYDHNDQGPQPNANPLVLNTGLVAGLLDGIGNQILGQINDQTRAALDFLANQRIEGRFWSI